MWAHVLAAAAALVLCGCTIGSYRTSDAKTMVGLVQCTAVHELAVECPAGEGELVVTFSHTCTAGTLRLQVLSPSGTPVVAANAAAGTGEAEHRVASRPGRWRCRIELDGYSGDYCAALAAAGRWPPITTSTRSIEVR